MATPNALRSLVIPEGGYTPAHVEKMRTSQKGKRGVDDGTQQDTSTQTVTDNDTTYQTPAVLEMVANRIVNDYGLSEITDGNYGKADAIIAEVRNELGEVAQIVGKVGISAEILAAKVHAILDTIPQGTDLDTRFGAAMGGLTGLVVSDLRPEWIDVEVWKAMDTYFGEEYTNVEQAHMAEMYSLAEEMRDLDIEGQVAVADFLILFVDINDRELSHSKFNAIVKSTVSAFKKNGDKGIKMMIHELMKNERDQC